MLLIKIWTNQIIMGIKRLSVHNAIWYVPFLVVSTRLYKRVCPSASVGPSVRPSGTLSLGGQKQRRRTTYAVYPALFLLFLFGLQSLHDIILGVSYAKLNSFHTLLPAGFVTQQIECLMVLHMWTVFLSIAEPPRCSCLAKEEVRSSKPFLN